MQVHSETETPGKFRQIVRISAHTIYADLIVDKGGDDSAPGPHEFFDTSLATCKALTAAWYAKKNNIALERIEVDVARDDTKEREGTYRLSVKVAFFGPLSADDKKKIYAAIAHCPIHKLMTTSTVEIETAPLDLG